MHYQWGSQAASKGSTECRSRKVGRNKRGPCREQEPLRSNGLAVASSRPALLGRTLADFDPLRAAAAQRAGRFTFATTPGFAPHAGIEGHRWHAGGFCRTRHRPATAERAGCAGTGAAARPRRWLRRHLLCGAARARPRTAPGSRALGRRLFLAARARRGRTLRRTALGGRLLGGRSLGGRLLGGGPLGGRPLGGRLLRGLLLCSH